MKSKLLPFSLVFLFLTVIPSPASAHEAYVLPTSQFMLGLKETSPNVLSTLVSQAYVRTTIEITILVFLIYILSIVFSKTKIALWFDVIMHQISTFGFLFIRLTVALALFFSAQYHCFLGPEITLIGIPGEQVIQFLLYLTSLMIGFGLLTEIAAIAMLGVYFYLSMFYGIYMVTYINYFTELILLLCWGSRFLSIDYLFFRKEVWFSKLKAFQQYEIPFLRIGYAISLLYAGYTIKILHTNLTIAVYNQYHLQNIFHASAQYIVAGAAIAELLIGLCILIGFSQRITILISLIFITLSVIYFQEMVWPHLILYGISVVLFINAKDKWTLDYYIKERVWKKQR